MTDYDFSCYVLKYEVESIRGLRYKKDLFAPQDGEKLPLIWDYRHYGLESVLGHVVLENRPDGVYAYCYLSDTPSRKAALKVLGEVALGPYVTGHKEEYGYIVKGRIASCSLMLERMDDDEAYHPVLNEDKKEITKMSGGSLNYLYCRDPNELFDHIREMEEAEEFLLREGYTDVAKDVRRLIEYVITSRNRIEVLQENLKEVFKSIEWYTSADSTKERVGKAVEEYRRR